MMCLESCRCTVSTQHANQAESQSVHGVIKKVGCIHLTYNVSTKSFNVKKKTQYKG